jgi:hypothetical protein
MGKKKKNPPKFLLKPQILWEKKSLITMVWQILLFFFWKLVNVFWGDITRGVVKQT